MTAHGRSDRGWLASAVLLALALRAPYAAVPPGVDEAGVAYIASRWDDGGGSLYGAHWLDRPPLLLLLVRIAAAGGDLGVRALGAAAAVAVVVLAAATARAVAGRRAAVLAAVLAAALTGSVASMAAYAPAELVAAAPSAAAVLCLVRAHRRGGLGWLAGAGALAACALLVKQSFLDAAAAAAVFVLASSAGDARAAARKAGALLAGAAVPVGAVALWQALAGLPAGALVYALVGFRIDALRALAGDEVALDARLARLVLPALGSATVLVVPLALAGLARLRADRPLMWTAAAWLAAGVAGVGAGGSYWAHYLVQIVPACAVLAAVALAAAPRPHRGVAAGAVAGLVAVVNGLGVERVRERTPQALERAAAAFVRDHARPGDTQYVMYARANVLRFAGLPSPYPYAWSLMVRVVPGATERLRALLASDGRPTWLLQWQDEDAWGLDPRGRTQGRLHAHYRRAAGSLCGRSVHVWLRRDDARPLRCPRACPPFPPDRDGPGDAVVSLP